MAKLEFKIIINNNWNENMEITEEEHERYFEENIQSMWIIAGMLKNFTKNKDMKGVLWMAGQLEKILNLAIEQIETNNNIDIPEDNSLWN